MHFESSPLPEETDPRCPPLRRRQFEMMDQSDKNWVSHRRGTSPCNSNNHINTSTRPRIPSAQPYPALR